MNRIKILRYLLVIPVAAIVTIFLYYFFNYILSSDNAHSELSTSAVATFFKIFSCILIPISAYWMAPDKKGTISIGIAICIVLFILFGYNYMPDLGFLTRIDFIEKVLLIWLVILSSVTIYGVHRTKNRRKIEELSRELDDLDDKLQAIEKLDDSSSDKNQLSKQEKTPNHELLRLKGLHRALTKLAKNRHLE